ncbi:hypothetical protein BH11MYX4_BH11MYX4_60920 [soil metagenome]
MRTALCLALCALGLTGCVKVDYIPLNAAPRPMTPRDPDKVTVFQTQRPDRPYVEVATIEVVSPNGPTSAMERLRQEAGERGCDALVLTGTKDSTTITATNRTVTSTQNSGYRGTCIVFTDGDAPPPVAPAAPGASL